MQGGSYGHGMATAQWGMEDGDFSFYGAAEGVTDEGWRLHSQSNLARLYADAGWRFGDSEIHLVASGAAIQPGRGRPHALSSLIQRNRKSVYTFPQTTRNSDRQPGAERQDASWTTIGSSKARAYVRALQAAPCRRQ